VPPRQRVVVHSHPKPLVIVAVTAAVAVAVMLAHAGGHVGWYGAALSALLAAKLALAMSPTKPWPGTGDDLYVGVIIPCYNEDPHLFRACLESIDAQDRMPQRVVIIDDGSPDPAALNVAREWVADRPWAALLALPENGGKRDAMAAGFLADAFKWDGGMDVVVTVDSDTRLDPAALAEITRPFSDPTVSAATGLVMASNARDAVLSRLVDLRYVNAFLYERGAYSRVGAVLCCCGSLAAYRAAVVYDNLDEFLTQTFLGVRQQFGDDRAMTNAALKVGRVVLARDAVAETAVPERLNHFLRQQARWGRSFYRESLRALQGLPVSNPAWWLTLIELASQAAFTAALVVSLVIRPALFGHVPAAAWAATIAASGWARSVFVFAVDRPGWTWRDRWLSFALVSAAPSKSCR
jgi:hyaluronan synthase